MASFKDIEKVLKKHKINIYISPTENTLMGIAGFLWISQDWIDADYSDDNLFEILMHGGKAISNGVGDEQTIEAINWAIEKAKEIGLKISAERQRMAYDKLINSEYEFDFSDISNEIPLSQIIERYGLPIAVRKSNWSGAFYIVVNSIKNGRTVSDAYRGNTLYEKDYHRKYSISDLFEMYGEVPTQISGSLSTDREYNESIKERIKAKDSFDEVEVNNTKILNHQKAGFLLAQRYNKFAFFYDTGTGKTFMSLSIIKDKQEKNDAHFLILCPKAIIKTAWMEDCAEYFPEIRILPISNNFFFEDCKPVYDRWEKHTSIPRKMSISERDWEIAQAEIDYEKENYVDLINKKWQMQNKIWNKMVQLADHYILNIEKFRYDPDEIMDRYEINGLIIDESAGLKNPNSLNAKTIFTYADDFKYIYMLSGKPAPNNSSEYYAQMKIVDPNTFYMSFDAFKKKYFKGSGSKMTPISPKAEDDVANMVANRSLIVSKDDCLTLPEMFQEIVEFSLPSRIMEQYDRLYRFCIFELQAREKQEKGAYYSAVCRLAIFTKLREIASGFLIDEYGDTISLHNYKAVELEKIVQKHPDEQIIVWCQFEYEIKEVEQTLSKYGDVVTAYGKTKNIDDSIKAFKHGDAKYMVAHPKSIKYGATFTGCCIAVYYAMSYSAEDYYQSRDRIYRYGQERICTYYFIQAKDTIDEIMYEAVDKKMSYAEVFSIIVKQAAKHGINYQEFKEDDVVSIQDELISTQAVKEKYSFVIDDILFTYKYNKQSKQSVLCNILLKDKSSLRPEEILFEIAYANKCDELEKLSEKEKREIRLCYTDVIEATKWVISEMKELGIKRIQKVYDYLEEQIQKQYEIDVANGAEQLTNLDVLSIKPETRRKHILTVEEKKEKRKFRFGPIGRAKKEKRPLFIIRNELEEVFFDSGKYRLTHNCFCGDNSVAHCHTDLGVIFQSKEDFENVTPESLFDLLHEIGHLETNTDQMTRQEEESFATQWALERMKLYDFKLPKKRQKEFEEYINGFSSRRNKILTKGNAAKFDWEE